MKCGRRSLWIFALAKGHIWEIANRLRYPQAVTFAATGAMAALDAERFLAAAADRDTRPRAAA